MFTESIMCSSPQICKKVIYVSPIFPFKNLCALSHKLFPPSKNRFFKLWTHIVCERIHRSGQIQKSSNLFMNTKQLYLITTWKSIWHISWLNFGEEKWPVKHIQVTKTIKKVKLKTYVYITMATIFAVYIRKTMTVFPLHRNEKNYILKKIQTAHFTQASTHFALQKEVLSPNGQNNIQSK